MEPKALSAGSLAQKRSFFDKPKGGAAKLNSTPFVRQYGKLLTNGVLFYAKRGVPFPVSWTVKMKKKQKETQDILSYHTQAAGCSDKARAKASGGRQPIEECGRTGL